MARKDDDTVAKLLDGEAKLFELRRNAREGEKSQLNERIAQLRQEITGLEEQTGAKKEEIVLVNKELEAVRGLWDKNLVQINRIMALEREAVRLDGESGTLVAAMAQAKGRIAEVELQIIQVDQNMRSDLSQDPHSGAQFYIVRLAIDENEIGNLKGLKLVPGMPVEAFIQTGKRSVLSYVIKPLEDQVARTFKEG